MSPPYERCILEEPPGYLLCPITRMMFREPVVVSSGKTYDRDAIKKWLRCHNTCPETRSKISNLLTPNLLVRTMVIEWLEKNPGRIPEGWKCRKMRQLRPVRLRFKKKRPLPPTAAVPNPLASVLSREMLSVTEEVDDRLDLIPRGLGLRDTHEDEFAFDSDALMEA